MAGKGSGRGAPFKTVPQPPAKPAAPTHPPLGSNSRAILDRYKSMGATYIRRTETAGGVLILEEVGIPNGEGGADFIPLASAELRLNQVQTRTPVPKEPKPQAKPVPKAQTYAEAAKVPKGPSNPFAPLEGLGWAEAVEEELSSTSSGGVATKLSKKASKEGPKAPPAKAPGPKDQETPKPAVEPKAQPSKDLEKRAVARFGVPLGFLLEALEGKERKRVLSILELSQSAFRNFLVLDGKSFRPYAKLLEEEFAKQASPGAQQPKAVESRGEAGRPKVVAAEAPEPSSGVSPAASRKSSEEATRPSAVGGGNSPTKPATRRSS